VFLTLRQPFKGLDASCISSVLSGVLHQLGLRNTTPKAFRHTGATMAIEAGMNPDVVLHIGHWKSSDVFYQHYVHSRPPANFTDAILGAPLHGHE
jgi:integrase